MCTSLHRLVYAVVTNNPQISAASHIRVYALLTLYVQWGVGQGPLFITVTQGPGLGRCHPDTGHWEYCLDMLSLLLTFHWPKQVTWPPNFKEPESYPSTTCLSRRENRNTWTAALMPIVIRMTSCPHLSGPRAFLECTLRAITEKVQGKPG